MDHHKPEMSSEVQSIFRVWNNKHDEEAKKVSAHRAALLKDYGGKLSRDDVVTLWGIQLPELQDIISGVETSYDAIGINPDFTQKVSDVLKMIDADAAIQAMNQVVLRIDLRGMSPEDAVKFGLGKTRFPDPVKLD